ncbi:MAG: RnfABCDGE type electron transport complex subunit A [Oscillospiraceae bacterium]|nr:RnfABCDGE type electron transport complex subunit A [Oscillospiraceae bacterium]
MNDITRNLLIILITCVLTENFVLSQFLGICPFLGVSKKTSSSLGMGLMITFVMFFATILTFPIYYFILMPLNIEFMNTIAFILIIALFVQLTELVLKKYFPALNKSLGIYLPLMTTNCAILGVTIMNVSGEFNFLEAVFNAFCAGLGFLLVMLIFSGIRARMERCDIPASLRGMPITLIAAGILSLSFIGFSGMVEGIFGA